MASLFKRSKTPRGLRPELPAAVPSNIWNLPTAWNEAVEMPTVTQAQMLGLPAAFRCVQLIANGVAAMAPLKMFKSDGVTEVTPSPILTRPNVTYTAFDFWHMAVSSAVMRGNFVAILADYGPDGYPQQMVPVSPELTSIRIDEYGYTKYDVGGWSYSADEVLHVRAFSTPGSPYGVGVVEQFRRTIGAALDQQSMSADTYKSGSVPSGIITIDRPEISAEQAQDVQDQWTGNHGGLRRPAVLPQSMSFSPLSWSPDDLQFLERSQLSIAETAFMFGLDPSDLGASVGGASLTYANVEQRSVQRVVDTYGPMMLRFEQAFSDLIPGGNTARFCPENLLRTDSKTRAEVDGLDITSGVRTKDEARFDRGLPPLTAAQKAEQDTAVKPNVIHNFNTNTMPQDPKAAA